MTNKSLKSVLIVSVMALAPVQPAMADAGDFIAGALLGAVANQAARNNKQKRTRTRTVRKARPRLPSTQEGREIQSSLNYFGFDAGTVDGQLGRKSKNAISNYQIYLGYAPTGQLSAFERNLLISSYNRAQAGGFATQQLVAGTPDGTRGLLRLYRDEMAGNALPQNGTPVPTVMAVAPPTTVVVNPAPVVNAAPTVPVPELTAAPVAVAAAQPAPASPNLPNFMGGGAAQSLASHCNKISLLTNSNGGFTTSETLVDANFALNEQFCLARTYAIAEGEELAQAVQGFTPDQIAAQCKSFGPAMKEHVAALSLKPTAEVMQGVSSFILQTGMSPAQMAGSAKICLSVGYRTDDMDVAVGSALILTVLGEKVYGELLGHHLAQGFGTSSRRDLALAWYDMGLTAVENGATPAFMPGMSDRTKLLRKASMSFSGQTQQQLPSAEMTPQPAALPAFGLPQ